MWLCLARTSKRRARKEWKVAMPKRVTAPRSEHT